MSEYSTNLIIKINDYFSSVFNDNPGLAERMDLNRIRFVNARISLACCRRLNIRRLSEVVEESLPQRFTPAALRMTGADDVAHASQLSQTMASQQFVRGVAQIIAHQTPRSETGGRVEIGELETIVSRTLAHISVTFVTELRTCFLVGGNDVTLAHGGGDQRRGDGVRSLSFVDHTSNVVYIAAGSLPGCVSAEQVLASALADLLRSSNGEGGEGGGALSSRGAIELSDLLPLAAICGSAPDDIPSVLSELRVCGVSRATLRGMQRGCVGAALLDEDSSLLQLTPLRVYTQGEIVAWEMTESSSRSGQGRGMRYGRVTDVGGASDEASSHDFGGIRQIKVEVEPERFQLFLTSQIYSFKSSAGTLSKSASAAVSDSAAAKKTSASVKSIKAALERDSRREDGGGGGGPADVDASSAASSSSIAATDGSASIAPASVNEAMLLEAVDGILQRAGLSLGEDRKSLMEANLVLRERLARADVELQTAVRSRHSLSLTHTEGGGGHRLLSLSLSLSFSLFYTNDTRSFATLVSLPPTYRLTSSRPP